LRRNHVYSTKGKTHNNNATLLGVCSTSLVASQRQLLDPRGVFIAHNLPRLVGRYVDILVAQFSLGRGRVYRLRELLALFQASGLLEAMDRLSLLVSAVWISNRICGFSLEKGAGLTLPMHFL
jgi:hypothetical protein